MRKKALLISGLVLLVCGILIIMDGILKPPYWVKYATKFLLFLFVPLGVAKQDTILSSKSLFRVEKRGIALALCLGIPLYGFIVGGYFLLRRFFDFSAVVEALGNNAGIYRDNFLWIALYISLVNSLLEEFFFRGFAFAALKEYSMFYAYSFSALAFSLYHSALMFDWFTFPLYLLFLLGLFLGGLLFNYLNHQGGSLYPSWVVHLFSNLGINTIGCILFGIL